MTSMEVNLLPVVNLVPWKFAPTAWKLSTVSMEVDRKRGGQCQWKSMDGLHGS